MPEDSTTEKPEWWLRNERDREALGLPEYDPPKFEDDMYVHETVDELEDEYDCSLQILGVGTDYLEEWEVRIDGETAFQIPRYRNENGNTVYRISATEFRSRVADAVE